MLGVETHPSEALFTLRMRKAAAVAVGLVAVAWAVGPLVLLFAHARSHGTAFTGAQGPFPADQYQYMAWIRDSSRHFVAADLFTLRGAGHVFLHPMFALSAALVGVGLGVRAAYLMWVPIAAAVLVGGVWIYVRRLLPADSWQRPAALALALLFVTPVALLGINLHDTPSELFSAGQLAGYLPAAIVVGLMPLYFLSLDRVLDARRWAGRGAAAAALGLAVGWIHPWQGATLALATAALAVWLRDLRSASRLIAPATAAALPVLYYAALPRFDAGWQISSKAGMTGAFPP